MDSLSGASVTPLSLLTNEETRETSCDPTRTVYERNTRLSVGKDGWNAMPSSPISPPEVTREVRLMNSVVVVGLATAKRLTMPLCWTTYQYALLFAGCSIATD